VRLRQDGRRPRDRVVAASRARAAARRPPRARGR
jgi:hypothetical protein